MCKLFEAIGMGMVVANFLLNTDRGLKAIDLCKECLIILNSKVLENKRELFRPMYLGVYKTMIEGYHLINDYTRAIACSREFLVFLHSCGERTKEANITSNLGNFHQLQGKHAEAKDFYRKALDITIETGNRQGEASCYGNLGTTLLYLGNYAEAAECLKKAIDIARDVHDRVSLAACYRNLGIVYHHLGEYFKAKESKKRALLMAKITGNKKAEAECYRSVGDEYISLGEYGTAEEYQRKALVISKEIGDRKEEGRCYGHLGRVYECLEKYGEAEDYQQRALVIAKETGDRRGQAECLCNLGTLFRCLGKYTEAKKYHGKALEMGKEMGDINFESIVHLLLACDALLEADTGSHQEAVSNLLVTIQKCEKMRSFLGGNEQFHIWVLEEQVTCYHVLSALFCESGKPEEALCIADLGRARALADLMSSNYALKRQTSSIRQSWLGIERATKKATSCTFLYTSYWDCYMFLWVPVKEGKPILLLVNVNDRFVNKGRERKVDEAFIQFGAETWRVFHGLSEENCEDRSLFPIRDSSPQDVIAAVRLLEDEEEVNREPPPSLAECYNIIISPVVDFLTGPELVIVPDRFLYKVPFAALKDEKGTYLSETFRIRVVPSLTTLSLIQDCPADYHSETGALIVGDPAVGHVLYKGSIQRFSSLPCARTEAEMIGRLLGVEPLLGDQATKQAVLQSIHPVSLIHFAAHGNADRGEIALAPQSPTTTTPHEEDYLLTMADISQVQLRAKLVVLSCCHSAHGQIRAEGVIGIARAFLGSGARSVLVALWAIPDKATEVLMSRFYEHLVKGESASESLHQAMKWMRSNGYSDVRQWAPFMLIGDNVTFDFAKQK